MARRAGDEAANEANSGTETTPENTTGGTQTPSEAATEAVADAAERFRIHFLDMGTKNYGDCILCEIGDARILIDGGHPGDDRLNEANGTLRLQNQIGGILGQPPPYRFDLLVVTHCHNDHIGCLPSLVERGFVAAEWVLAADPDLGWDMDTPTDGPAGLLAAALREDSPVAFADEAELWQFALDARDLEARYRDMLTQLRQGGGTVVRYGVAADRPRLQELAALFEARAGMRILGPTPRQLDLCADRIEGLGRDFQARTDALASSDADQSLLQTYRLLRESADAPGVGAAINNQSLVLLFERAGRKALLAGDMQFAEPEVPGLESEMNALRQTVAAYAPFDLYKIGHHGSYNALDDPTLAALGDTRLLVISTGRAPGPHPNPTLLRLLRRNRTRLRWFRNDRNGVISVDLAPSAAGPVRVVIDRGAENDASRNPPRPDVPSAPARQTPPLAPITPQQPPPVTVSPAPPQTLHAAGGPEAAAPQMVEIHARVPHVATRVTFAVTVEPGAGQAAPVVTAGGPGGSGGATTALSGGAAGVTATDTVRLAGGRALPPLLFVTDTRRLGERIGPAAAQSAVAAVRAAGQSVADLADKNAADAAQAAALVRPLLTPGIRGVVLLGGHAVVPMQRIDTIAAALRARLPAGFDDLDDFIVWSDDVYGDRENDGAPDLPVSRVPDGGNPVFFLRTLQATDRRGGAPMRGGVRNIKRPFADAIFQNVRGTEALYTSSPETDETIGGAAPALFTSERLYLMLHGDWRQPDRFTGEGVGREAVNLRTLPGETAPVVFTGCCWGALCVDQPASIAVNPVKDHTPDTSLALRFLQGGSLAFIGNTGVHYSPGPAADILGGPMHRAFWYYYDGGSPPAEALFRAKRSYALGIPHRPGDPVIEAIEQKILRQYTCLGLGW